MNAPRLSGEGDFAYYLRIVLIGSTAASFAEIATIPFDTAKVRLQLQKINPGELPKYSGLVGTMRTVSMEEGKLSLYRGLTPGIQRQIVFSGLRVGMYVPVRNFFSGELAPGQNPTLLQKIAAGITTGAIAITVANPTDVVKVRLQAQG